MNRTVRYVCFLIIGGFMSTEAIAQENSFNGLHMGLGNLSRLSRAKT
jgi:hypothetical protein